jgi:hypothetical protein
MNSVGVDVEMMKGGFSHVTVAIAILRKGENQCIVLGITSKGTREIVRPLIKFWKMRTL